MPPPRHEGARRHPARAAVRSRDSGVSGSGHRVARRAHGLL